MIAETIAKKFTEEAGVEVEFITGGTIDRLNRAKLAADDPESDITFTTSHVGRLYQMDGHFEELDLPKIPAAQNFFFKKPRSDPVMSASGLTSTQSPTSPIWCPMG